ncbi:MAG: hypothetical protein II372_02180, partial [Clostridia bacterium]|nr:hypothetical protein [Clostridia bacterium]
LLSPGELPAVSARNYLWENGLLSERQTGGRNEFYVSDSVENFANLETVTIPSSINVIGKYAFKGCTSATFVFEGETTWACDFGYISVWNPDRMASHYENVTLNVSTSGDFTSRYLTYNTYTIRYENYERETINQPLYNAILTKQ